MTRVTVITDPRFEPPAQYSFLSRLALRVIRDPRDLPFVALVAQMTLVLVPCALVLFIPGVFRWWYAPLYWVLLIGLFLDRYILMLHNTSHRKFYKKRWQWLEFYIPSLLGLFAGQTPNTYFTHHIGMHHPEENLEGDLSSTMSLQRDSFFHFVRYWLRFFFLNPVELTLYHLRKGNRRYALMTAFGELLSYAGWVLLGIFAGWGPTATVFLVPVVIVRIGFMTGNWGQHAFIDPSDPTNPYLSSIVMINSRYNRRCFNDGYHIGHHESCGRHWTDMPGDFEAKRDRYIANDAIVFERLDNSLVWLLLMLKRYDTLAEHFVELRDEPRSKDQIIALFKRRLAPVPFSVPAPAVQ